MKAAEIETLKFSTTDKMVTHDWGAAFDQCADEKDKLWHCLNNLVNRLQSSYEIPSQLGRLETKQAIKLAVACLNATKVDDI